MTDGTDELLTEEGFLARLGPLFDALSHDEAKALFRGISDDVLADPECHAVLDRYQTVDRVYFKHWRLSGSRVFPELLAKFYEDPEGRRAVSRGLVRVAKARLGEQADDHASVEEVMATITDGAAGTRAALVAVIKHQLPSIIEALLTRKKIRAV